VAVDTCGEQMPSAAATAWAQCTPPTDPKVDRTFGKLQEEKPEDITQSICNERV